MKTYTITRNGETIGHARTARRETAAWNYAKKLVGREPAGSMMLHLLPDGTYQAGIWQPTIRQFEPVGQPFMVEA